MGKQDRTSKLVGSLKNSMATETSAIDRRFAAAEETFQKTGGVLLAFEQASPRVAAVPSAEQSPDVVLTVPIDKVHDNPENSRQCYPEEDVEELTELISTHGQKDPVQAMPHPELPGEWMLLSGHKRKRSLLRAGKSEIRLIPHLPVFGIERYKLSLSFNAHTRESALDNARAWSRLLEAGHVRTYDELADKLGVTKSLLSKTLAFNKLPEHALMRIREHPHRFGATAGQFLQQIAQTADEDELMRIVEGVAEERITTRQLETLAKRGGDQRKGRKAKLNSRQYRIKAGDVEVGVLKDWDHGRVSLEVKLDDPKKRVQLVELLKKELAIE